MNVKENEDLKKEIISTEVPHNKFNYSMLYESSYWSDVGQ